MTAPAVPYETFHRDEEVAGPSNRSFGLVFTAVFGVVALFPVWRGEGIRPWAVAVSALCGALALFWPRVLAPANRVWFRVGVALHRIVNPLVMGLLFYAVVTPFAVVMRRFRTGLVRRLRPDRAARSYWIAREQAVSRMDQQF